MRYLVLSHNLALGLLVVVLTGFVGLPIVVAHRPIPIGLGSDGHDDPRCRRRPTMMIEVLDSNTKGLALGIRRAEFHKASVVTADGPKSYPRMLPSGSYLRRYRTSDILVAPQ